MNKILIYALVFNLALQFLPTSFAKNDTSEEIQDKRACWISFLDIETSLKDLSCEDYTARINEMYDLIVSMNLDTVIFHVRPMADALYPSDVFPLSTYISTDRKAMEYDPLEIAVSEAHKKGLYFEAWINPYRVSKNDETTAIAKETEFFEKYKDLMIEYTNLSGELCYSLDPAKEEARKIIVDGVKEIVTNYDVDGIHFDDYFYVQGMNDSLDVNAKKENVNILVKDVYKSIKEIDETCTFGISPAGNIDNARAEGVDVDTWLSEEGYVDYITPQIYWSDTYIIDENTVNMYSDRCNAWMLLNKNNTSMYVGLGLYRVGEQSNTDIGWCNSSDNIKRQYEYALSIGFDGFALFRYEWLEHENAKTECENLKTYLHEQNPNHTGYVETDVYENEEKKEEENKEEEKNEDCVNDSLKDKEILDIMVDTFKKSFF